MINREESRNRLKVMANILNRGMVAAGFEARMIEWMIDVKDKYGFSLFFPTDRSISNNRNKIVKKFLGGSCYAKETLQICI